MLDLKLNAEHESNLHGFVIAMNSLEDILNDPDTYDGVICMDKNHRLMFDTDVLRDNIMEYINADYRDYYKVLADKEAEDEN